MTTNGITLKRHLAALKDAGLTHLNVSLDTLVPDKFEQIARRPGFHRVLDAIHAAIDQKFRLVKVCGRPCRHMCRLRAVVSSKLAGPSTSSRWRHSCKPCRQVNCVVMRGFNDMELVDFVEMTRALPVDVRFIEYMPFDENAWSDNKFVSYKDMVNRIRERYPTFDKLHDHDHDTAKAYGVPGFVGQVGPCVLSKFCMGVGVGVDLAVASTRGSCVVSVRWAS